MHNLPIMVKSILMVSADLIDPIAIYPVAHLYTNNLQCQIKNCNF